MKRKMINEQEFVEIIDRLKNTDDTVNKVNKIFRNTIDSDISDFMNAASLMICHEDIVVKLLENMFNDKDTLSWWLYEKAYGRAFEIGDFEDNGVKIDLTTTERLYDYLIEKMERIA